MARKAKPKQVSSAQGDMIAEGLMADGYSDAAEFALMRPEEQRKAKVYTLETVKRLRPQDYEAAKAQLAGGMPGYRVASAFGFSPHTIQAIKNEGLTVAQQKQRLGNMQMLASELATEAVIEDLMDPEIRKKIPTVQKMMVSGIGSQRGAENLSNGVSVAIQVQVPMSVEQYQAALARAAESMGSEGGGNAPKGATTGTAWPVAASGGVGQGDAAPRVMEARETQGEGIIEVTP